ncbi:MAG TPA: TIGR02147 family protein [Fibrobacteria bacterium]|nr:TIGR02147 family protein [Fibrobacteria bacterium]
MHPVYAHLDWRAFVREAQEELRLRESSFTWKHVAESLGMDPAQLARILRGSAPLPFRYVPGLSRLFDLDRRASAYLEELLRLDRVRSEDERVRCRARLAALRGVATREIGGLQAEFYTRWHHAALRALVGMGGHRGDGSNLGELCQPPVPPEDARHSVELLMELGLVERDRDGVLRTTEAHLLAGPDIPVQVVRGFHRQGIELSRMAIASVPPEERDISAVTATLDEAGFAAAREMARELRRKVQSLAHRTTTPDRIYQLGIQIFPVAAPTASESP